MAFEKLFDFIESLEKEYDAVEVKLVASYKLSDSTSAQNVRNRAKLRSEQNSAFMHLLEYHNTVCQTAKFKAQKAYARQILFKMNPAFCKGYFKADK